MNQQKKNNIQWYDPNDTLSYGCLYNFVVGDRGGGKTFNTLKFLINRFLKHGEQFIYLRRTMEELKDALPGLFSYLQHEGYFLNHEFKSSKKGLYIDNKLMGLPKALSTSMTRKSLALPKVKWIMFEEFMVDGVTSRYLGAGSSEVFIFNNFYETVARLRDDGDEVRCIFLSNAFSTVNIYFTEHNVKLPMVPPYKRYNRFNKDVLVVIWHEDSYVKAKAKTRHYKLNEGSEFNRHAYGNEFYLDTSTFIKEKDKNSDYHFAMVFMGTTYTVWANWNKGEYYVTNKGGSISPINTFSLTLEDNNPNNINIRRVKNMPFMKAFRNAVDENNVYYNNLKTQAALKEAIFLMRTTR